MKTFAALILCAAVAGATCAAAAEKPLPLAGITAGQVSTTLHALAQRHGLTVDDASIRDAVQRLSGKVDCARLGLLCRLVGKKRVSGILRTAWAAQSGGADFNDTLAAFDKAVMVAARQQMQENYRPGEERRLEKALAEAVFKHRIDPNDTEQVEAFLKAHTTSPVSFPFWTFKAGAGLKCDSRRWSYTPAFKPWKWQFRALSGCAGTAWGELTLILGWGQWTLGSIVINSTAAYTRSICYCWPQNASPITTQINFQNNSASASSNSPFVTKTVFYVYVPPKSGSFTTSSNEPGVVALSFGDPLSF